VAAWGYLITLTDVLARPAKQRDLDAAAARGIEAIQLVETLDSTRSIGLIRDLCQQLAPHTKVPAVRDFVARARDLVSGIAAAHSAGPRSSPQSNHGAATAVAGPGRVGE
jgi:hypothetical protein